MIETKPSLESCRDSMASVVCTVMETMLGVQAKLLAEPPPEGLSRTVVGAIHLAGNWRGVLLFECGPLQAAAFTEQLAGVPAPKTVDADVRDAIGEIVSMVAGNVKTILPSGTFLSSPTVVEGHSFTVKICGGNESIQLHFDSDKGPFFLTLVEVTEEN